MIRQTYDQLLTGFLDKRGKGHAPETLCRDIAAVGEEKAMWLSFAYPELQEELAVLQVAWALIDKKIKGEESTPRERVQNGDARPERGAQNGSAQGGETTSLDAGLRRSILAECPELAR